MGFIIVSTFWPKNILILTTFNISRIESKHMFETALMCFYSIHKVQTTISNAYHEN